MVSSTLVLVSMVALGLATAKPHVLIAITVYGLGQGMTSPTLFAWATDLSDERHKGRGISTLYIFMEMGIGIGAFLSGFIYANDSSNFFVTFLTAGSLSGAALLYLIFTRLTGRPRVETKTVTLTDVEQIP